MNDWIEPASSWKVVEVVRPQPGHAATSGTKVRKPTGLQDFLTHLHFDRAVAAGSGVSDTRMVSPMPDLQQDAERRRRGDDAL